MHPCWDVKPLPEFQSPAGFLQFLFGIWNPLQTFTCFFFFWGGEDFHPQLILLMEEILHHQGCIKPCKLWDKLPTSTGVGFQPSTSHVSLILQIWTQHSHRFSPPVQSIAWIGWSPWPGRNKIEKNDGLKHLIFVGRAVTDVWNAGEMPECKEPWK